MSICINCNQEISPVIVDGRPVICAWTPPGAGKSVYTIVSAHIMCMTIDQLRQCLESHKAENEQRGYMSQADIEVERRLSWRLASEPAPVLEPDIKWLEMD